MKNQWKYIPREIVGGIFSNYSYLLYNKPSTVGNIIVPMINPVILKKEKPYDTEENCLSLIGFRKTKRYEMIEVEHLDKSFKKQKQVFTEFTAQIIQHEMDHFEGIII